MSRTRSNFPLSLVASVALLATAAQAPAQYVDWYCPPTPAVSYYPSTSYYVPSTSYYYSAPAVSYYAPSTSYYYPSTSYYYPSTSYYSAPAMYGTMRYGLFGNRVSSYYYPSYYYWR
jgi:hypothetical protein